MASLPIDTQFDVRFANRLAKAEAYNRHLYRPNSYLHKWWARRCGTTFRLILQQLADHPTDFYQAGGLEGKLILDPMMGGGTTLHEAIRLGANVIGGDLDPIPVLQARATLTDVPLADLQTAFAELWQGLASVLSPLHQIACPQCQHSVPAQFMLYGQQRQHGAQPVIVVDGLTLRRESDGTHFHLDPTSHAILRNGQPFSRSEGVYDAPLIERKIGSRLPKRIDLPYYERFAPLAIAGKCAAHGFFFAGVSAETRSLLKQTNAKRHNWFERDDFQLANGQKSADLRARGVDNYLDLFSGRQLCYLHHAAKLLRHHDDAIQLNLALLISTSLEYHSLLCGYKGAQVRRAGAVRQTFAYHAYSVPYTALENNPVYPTRRSGSLRGLFAARIERGRRWAAQPVERKPARQGTRPVAIEGEQDFGVAVSDVAEMATETSRFLLLHGNSAELPLPDQTADHIVTDPPYYDSVQYSDLAAYFHVWLRQLLPDALDWSQTTAASAVGSRERSAAQYAAALTGIWRECARLLKPEGRLIFTFHHRKPEAWAALTISLRSAGFQLINAYVVRSESSSSIHTGARRSLLHDAVLVFGRTSGRDWPPVSQLTHDDSEQFVTDCANTIGWLLQERLDDEAICAVWRRLH